MDAAVLVVRLACVALLVYGGALCLANLDAIKGNQGKGRREARLLWGNLGFVVSLAAQRAAVSATVLVAAALGLLV